MGGSNFDDAKKQEALWSCLKESDVTPCAKAHKLTGSNVLASEFLLMDGYTILRARYLV